MAGHILITDDHPLFRSALRHAVAKVWPDAAIMEADSVAGTRQVGQDGVELLLLDLHMRDSDGLAALMDFRADWPAVPVVVVSGSEEPQIAAAARQLGATGFIPKSADLATMREALERVRNGDLWFAFDRQEDDVRLERIAGLTPAQRRILTAIRAGLLNKQIAHEAGISEATVKAHVTAIFRKLGVISRTQAALVAQSLDVDRPTTTGL